MFNTLQWLANSVRTSQYQNPDEAIDLGNMNIDAKSLASSLMAITDLDLELDTSGQLLPARLAKDIRVPPAVWNDWNTLASELSSGSGTLHPAVKHLMLGLALASDDVDERKQRLDSIKSLYTEGRAYQPTITWVSLLNNDWYEVDTRVTPSVRGGNKVDDLKGTSTSLLLTKDKIRVNPADLFTSTKVIDVKDADIMAPAVVWNDVASNSKTLDYPLTTSIWLFALADKATFWNDVSVGAALYSPFYSSAEIDALVVNQAHEQGAGFFFRPGNGITDIYPLQNDPVLSNLFNVEPIFEAPLSTGGVCAIKNLAYHPGSPVGLPQEWGTYVFEQVKLMRSMDLVPSYSAFSEDSSDLQKSRKMSSAYDLLEDFAETGDPVCFDELLNVLLRHQMELVKKFDNQYVDAAESGYPHTYKYVEFENRLNISVPQCVLSESLES